MIFTDQISVLIFSLIMLAVIVFMTMSKVIIGPISKLRDVEKIILVLSVIGVILVVAMAASELLFRLLF